MIKKILILIVILSLFACEKSNPIEDNREVKPLVNTPNNTVVKQETLEENLQENLTPNIREDSTKIETILQEKNQLQTAQAWQFKALFIKVNQTENPPQLNYYYYQSIYEDSNNNQIQDSPDQGFFNPASTVKVGISALVLEKLNNLNLGLETQYRITGTSQWYSIQEDIKKSLIISDNSATNRLILFLGFNQLQTRMQSLEINSYSVNRLMLDQGTLVNSPALELKFQDKIIPQPSQATTVVSHCFEIAQKTGNCANAKDLAEIFMRLVQPEFYPEEKRFKLRENDRIFLLQMLSKTPQEVGLNYENTFCRFLDPLGKKFANNTGILLNKCGIGLFTHSFVDSSFLETDTGQKYYIIMAVNPPNQISQNEAINWFNLIAELILKADL